MALLVERARAEEALQVGLMRLGARVRGHGPRLDLLPPHPDQARILAEAGRFNVLAAGRRYGKTSLADHIAVAPVAAGRTVFWFSVTFRNQVEVWDAVRAALAPVTHSVSAVGRRIRTLAGGLFEMFSLWEPIAVRGRSCDVAIIDEAAHDPDLEATWERVVRPTLVDRRGAAWFLSSPNGLNYFHSLWQRGQPGPERRDGWVSWQRPSHANPHLPPDELALAERDTPPDVFRQEYLAQFVTDATRFFDPAWWLGDANRYDAAALVEHPARVQTRAVVWDTALKDRQQNAYSAAVVLEVLADDRLAVREVWRGRPRFPALVAEVERIAARWNHDGKLGHVVVEDKASGTSLVQTLAAQAPDWLARLVRAFPVAGPKPARWAKAAVWCAQGGVLFPSPSPVVPWLGAFEDELFAVPHAPFLDQADAFAEGVIYLEHFLGRWRTGRGGGP